MDDFLGTLSLPIRPPFTDILAPSRRYNESGTPLCDAFVIGIAGGSASGKVGPCAPVSLGLLTHNSLLDACGTRDREAAFGHSKRGYYVSGAPNTNSVAAMRAATLTNGHT